MPVLLPSLNPLKALHRLRHLHRVRQLRRRLGHPLPVWALGEVRLAAPTARWLLQTLCTWHALPAHGLCGPEAGALPLNEVTRRLALHGLDLRACRLAEAGALQTGDVVVLLAPLAGHAASMALVVDAPEGADSLGLQLAPAGTRTPEVRTFNRGQLQAVMAGWVLRSRQQAPRAHVAHAPLAMAA